MGKSYRRRSAPRVTCCGRPSQRGQGIGNLCQLAKK